MGLSPDWRGVSTSAVLLYSMREPGASYTELTTLTNAIQRREIDVYLIDAVPVRGIFSPSVNLLVEVQIGEDVSARRCPER